MSKQNIKINVRYKRVAEGSRPLQNPRIWMMRVSRDGW